MSKRTFVSRYVFKSFGSFSTNDSSEPAKGVIVFGGFDNLLDFPPISNRNNLP